MFSFFFSSVVSFEALCMLGLAVSVVNENCKTLILVVSVVIGLRSRETESLRPCSDNQLSGLSVRPSSVSRQDGVVAVERSWCVFLGAVVVAALLRLLLDDWFAVSPVSCVPGQTPESRLHCVRTTQWRAEWFTRRAKEVSESIAVNVSSFEEWLSRVMFVAEALEHERPCWDHCTVSWAYIPEGSV